MTLAGVATALACTPFLDAPGTDFTTEDSGADSGGAAEFTYLKAEDPVIDAWFGYSLTWGGDALAVTAPFETYSSEAGPIERGGAVYLFEPSGRTWKQTRLQPLYAGTWDGNVTDEAGVPTVFSALHVVLDAQSIFVGVAADDSSSASTPHDNQMRESGALYVYDRARSGQFAGYVKAPVVKKNSLFGYALALSEEWLVVGAPGEDGNPGEQEPKAGSGAIYAYRRHGSRLEEPQRREAPNPGVGDRFGSSLALRGDRLFVGAPFEAGGSGGIDGAMDDDSMLASGAVYVYRLVGDAWVFDHYLKPAVPREWMLFGTALSVSDQTLAVGGPGPGSDGHPLKGSVTTFCEREGTWELEQSLAPDSGNVAVAFGEDVSLRGDRMLVGTPFDNSKSAADPRDRTLDLSGAVYSYERASTGSWVRQEYLKAPDLAVKDFFGTSVALIPGYRAVGAVEGARAPGASGRPDDNANSGPGGVYLFPEKP